MPIPAQSGSMPSYVPDYLGQFNQQMIFMQWLWGMITGNRVKTPTRREQAPAGTMAYDGFNNQWIELPSEASYPATNNFCGYLYNAPVRPLSEVFVGTQHVASKCLNPT
jgi:hypothetical protein